MINLVSEDAEEIMNQFSFLTSNITFKVCKTAEEYRNSKLMEELDLCWIKVLASPDYRTDPRNEAAAKIARQLSEIPFVSERMERPINPKMEEAAKKWLENTGQSSRVFQSLFSIISRSPALQGKTEFCVTHWGRIFTGFLSFDFPI